ncbi:MAG: hypothetical protein K9I85_10110 [Saprospiraceae bacterium]|nr:hypothetical protein [Saprospiraceae bacterium]
MSLFSDLKRLLFGAKAVTRSAAEKTEETVRETIRETKEDLDAWMERIRKEAGTEPPEATNVETPATDPPIEDPNATSSHTLKETGEDLMHKAGDLAEKTGSKILEQGKRVEEGIEEIGEKVLSAGEHVAEKAGQLAEKVGGEIMEKGGALLDKAKEMLKDTTDKAGEEAGKLFDKAQEEAAKHDLEKAAQKAEELARKARFESESPQGKSHLDALDDSLLEGKGKGGFFEKADEFAKGNYHHGEMTVEPGEPAEKPKGTGPTYGFEDRDGDGDDIIDDAEIVEDKPA